jgi:hypothetical protein
VTGLPARPDFVLEFRKLIQQRRFASFLIGAWLALSIGMDIVQVQNIRAADRLLGAPRLPVLEPMHLMGQEGARLFLRYFAAEQNRWYVEQWEWTQLAIGLCLVLFLVFGRRPPKIAICLCLLMFGVVLAARTVLTPWIDRLALQMDFLPAGTPLPVRLTMLRKVYSIMELVKLGLGLGVAGSLLIRKPADPQMFARESDMEETASRRRLPK